MLKFNTEAQRTQSFRSGDCFSAISVPLCLQIYMTNQGSYSRHVSKIDDGAADIESEGSDDGESRSNN